MKVFLGNDVSVVNLRTVPVSENLYLFLAIVADIVHSTGNLSSLVTVNVTLRNGVIIRVCMGNTSILWNSSK